MDEEIKENDQVREHSNQLLGDLSRKTSSQHNYRKTYTKVDFADESRDYLQILNNDGIKVIQSHAGSGANSGRSRGRQLSSNQSKHAYTVHTFGSRMKKKKMEKAVVKCDYTRKRYTCVLCGKTFSTKGNFLQHVKRRHETTE